MLHAVTHIGLSALLVIAPALCCCNVRLLAGQFGSFSKADTTHSSSQKDELSTQPSCCHAEKSTAPKSMKRASCCHQPAPSSENSSSSEKPTNPAPSQCEFCGERPHAIPPENAPTVAAPEPTGEVLPLVYLFAAAVAPEHFGLMGGLEPPERAGVDTRFTILFEHHVLRC